MCFPTKNDHFGVFWRHHHLRVPPNHPFYLGFPLFSPSILGETPLFLETPIWVYYNLDLMDTLTFWTLEISRVRMQTPGLPVTWGKIPGFSNKSWVCREKPGFFLFCRNFQFFLGWGGRCLAIHMIKLTYSVPFLAEGHNSTWLIYA